jgi:tRNA threonylcarbamoyladenosine biosynthesis protein TsaB
MSEKFVSIHGSYHQLEICLFQDNAYIDSVIQTEGHASSDLLPNLDTLFKKHHISLDNLSFMAVDKGPGAFTSLRVTIATVNGIAFQNKLPLVGVSGLEALTSQATGLIKSDSGVIITLLNAYNNDTYFLISELKSQACTTIAQGCQNINVLLDDLKKRFPEQQLFFCGQGSQLYASNIRHIFSAQALILEELLFASAKVIGQMAYNYWIKKENIENQIAPLYLKTQYFAIRK